MLHRRSLTTIVFGNRGTIAGWLILGLGIFCSPVLVPEPVPAAELVTLSPENYEEYRPAGPEVDAVWGDYVLRNERIVAVIADPHQHNGRSGSRRGNTPHGEVIDFSSRQSGNDTLGSYRPILYWPDHRSTPTPTGILNDANKQGDLHLAREKHLQPGREPKSGEIVTLTIPYGPAGRELKETRYSLGDGWKYLQLELVFENTTAKPIAVNPLGSFALGTVPLKQNPHLEFGVSPGGELFWACDPLRGTAYGVLQDEIPLEPFTAGVRSTWLMHQNRATAGNQPGFTLAPGEKKIVTRKLITGRNLFEVQAIAAELRGEKLRTLEITANNTSGAIPGTQIRAYVGDVLYGIGATDAQGKLGIAVPMEKVKLIATAPACQPQEKLISAEEAGPLAFEFPLSPLVEVTVTDEGGRPLPCKIQFRGLAPTPDPHFYSADGDEQVANIWQPASGTMRAPVPPGKYRVIVTRGIEYDAFSQEIEMAAGQTLKLPVKLRRSVDTSGWISAEFANKSTVSRLWSTSSVRGRVLNLLAEGIEFAPATEVNTVFSYRPLIQDLHAESYLATADGIHLAQPVRKSFAAQNAFPIKYVPGDQDGGIPQRPAHVFQIFWLSNVPHRLDQNGEIITTGGDRKLIQVTPPGIWPNDGRFEGMSWLFDERKTVIEDHMRNARLRELSWFHAMELQPLHVFLDLPAYDARDPQGKQDLAAWQAELDQREAKHWPEVKDRQRDWTRMLNLGYRITGVVNNAAKDNLHGSGFWRTYLHLDHDAPQQITADQVIDAVQAGATIMTKGPFLNVSLKAGDQQALPGQDISAKDHSATLHLRVQCPNWLDVDRVQILFNGHVVQQLTATRAAGSPGFLPHNGQPVRFERNIPLHFDADTMVSVIVSGTGENLRPQGNSQEATFETIALSNPIYVDVDGAGFQPHSPVDDRVFTRMDATGVPQASKVLPVKLTLKNTSDKSTTEQLNFEVFPAGAATVVCEETKLSLAPDEEKTVELSVTPTGDSQNVQVRLPRSTWGVGRRPTSLKFVLGKALRPQDSAYLYEQAPDFRFGSFAVPFLGNMPRPAQAETAPK